MGVSMKGWFSYFESDQRLQELFAELGCESDVEPPKHFELLIEVGLGGSERAKAKYGVKIVRARVNGRDTREMKGGTREEPKKMLS